MIVCAHGNVTEFCKSRDMLIIENHTGDLLEYDGTAVVLVTDKNMDEAEYCFTKGVLYARGVELVSTRYQDMLSLPKRGVLSTIVHRAAGRYKFGFGPDGELTEWGRAVSKRIFELRDSGCTYKVIGEDEKVCHMDGRKLNTSTIQMIIKNREIYEG